MFVNSLNGPGEEGVCDERRRKKISFCQHSDHLKQHSIKKSQLVGFKFYIVLFFILLSGGVPQSSVYDSIFGCFLNCTAFYVGVFCVN